MRFSGAALSFPLLSLILGLRSSAAPGESLPLRASGRWISRIRPATSASPGTRRPASAVSSIGASTRRRPASGSPTAERKGRSGLNTYTPAEAGCDSISFLPSLLNQPSPNKRDFLIYHSINGSFALREGDWTLALCPDSGGWSFPRPGTDKTTGLPPFQLFNTASDTAEKTNEYAAHPEIAKRLADRLRTFIQTGRSTPGPALKITETNAWWQTDWMRADVAKR